MCLEFQNALKEVLKIIWEAFKNALITDASSSLDSVGGTLIELGSQVNKNIHIFHGKFNFGKLFMEKSPQNVIKNCSKMRKKYRKSWKLQKPVNWLLRLKKP